MRRTALTLVAFLLLVPAKTMAQCIDLRPHVEKIDRSLAITSDGQSWASGLTIEGYDAANHMLLANDNVLGETVPIKLDSSLEITVTRAVAVMNMAVQSAAWEVHQTDEGPKTVTLPLDSLTVSDGMLAKAPEDCKAQSEGVFVNAPVFEAEKISVDTEAGTLVARGRMIQYELEVQGGSDVFGSGKGG